MFNKLKQYWRLLENRKTYILTSATAVLNIVVILYPNLLASSTILKIDGILVALGGAALRSAIGRQ